MDERETREKRLRYRCWHRGTKELDLLLGPYSDSQLTGLDPVQLDEFEVLLEMPEPILYALITGQADVGEVPNASPAFVAVVESLKAFHAEGAHR